MSQLTAPTRPIRRTHSGSVRVRPANARAQGVRPNVARPSVVTPATGARRDRFGFLVLALVLAGVVALLFLNTMRAEQSFTLTKLRSDVTTLQDRQEALHSELDAVSAPEQLALDASKLGLTRAKSVKYVDAKTKKTIGVAGVPGGGARLNVNTLPNNPASRAASSVLDAGTIGTHIVDPVLQKQKAAAAKAKADAKQAADDAERKAADAAKKKGAEKSAKKN